MTELLKTYENNFRRNENKIQNNFNKISLSKKSEIHLFLEENEKLMNEQSKIVKQMDIEISSLNGDLYEEYSVKVSSFKKSLELNKKKLNKLLEKVENKNSSFMSERNLLEDGVIKKEKYIFSNTEKLQNIQRVLSNTENMGNNIMVNMDGQTKGMKNINKKLKYINKDIDASKNVLVKMKSRSRSNKKKILLLASILFIVIIIVITYRILKIKK